MTTFLTIEEAAARLRLGKSSIRNYIRSGKLPAKKLTDGRQVLIEERDLMGLLSDVRAENKPVSRTEGKRPTALELLRMSPEERAPYLIASVEAALPLYAADLARPPTSGY